VPPEDAPDDLEALRFVGPATADVLADDGVTAADLAAKRVSHAHLVECGVNPGVAARIRREHSLQWSFEGGEDLNRRAEQVRGLKDDERQWVAASYGEDASADGSGSAEAAESAWQSEAGAVDAGADDGADGEDGSSGESDAAEGDGEAAWREQSWPDGRVDESFEREEREWREESTPTPVAELDVVDEETAALLSDAGVTSVRRLATAHVERVADSLGMDAERVRRLQDVAREHDE
jgi:hypothetical protein